MINKYRSPNRVHDREFFYKYMSAHVAKIVLTTRKLRWSSPLTFNDPFDITQELRLDFDEAVLVSALTERVADLLENGDPTNSVRHPVLAFLINHISSADADTRVAFAKELRNNLREPTQGQLESMAALRKKWSEMVPDFRVLCFSEVNDVTSMWLHYADNYKGIVVEFSVDDTLDSAFLMAKPIIYQDEPPSIASAESWVDCLITGDNAVYHKLFEEYQYVKTTDWAYEKEWRIVSSKRPGETGLFGEYQYHPQEIAGIYFGPKCSDADRQDITALLTNGLEHVRLYQAKLNNSTARFAFSTIDQ